MNQQESENKYLELTKGMSERNGQAFVLCPMFIGGDSTDIERFVVEVYKKPVTDENYKEVAKMFRQWYSEVGAINEYHEPTKLRGME